MKIDPASQSVLFNPRILIAPLSGALCSVGAFLMIFSFADAARASAPSQSSSAVANVPESFATGQGTGLVLGFDEGANIWFAHAVWAGSPAEQAGIPVGARVLSIGGIALPVGAIANEPSALTEIESRLGAAASVGSIAVGWVDSGGTLHNDQIRFEPLPDLYLRATVNGGSAPVQCERCDSCGFGCGQGCVPTSGPGNLFCQATFGGCVVAGNCMPLSYSYSVASGMTHGSAGTFYIGLPQTGTPGVECRSGGPSGNYSMVFTFVNNLVAVGSVSASGCGGLVSSSSIGPNLNQYTVNLTGVSNACYITVTLTGVVDVREEVGNVSGTMGVLIGDVNATGLVDGNDVSAVQGQARQSANSTNFRLDAGLIDGNDVSLVQSKTRTSLPSPP